MILYQSPLSTYSFKLRLALAVKGADLTLREPPGGSYRSAEYRALVPPATIPALVDGDFVLTESDAIIEYVDETCDGPPLMPADAEGRAQARMISRLVDLRLEAAIRSQFPVLKETGSLAPGALDAAERAFVLVCDMADPAGPWACGPDPMLPDFGLVAAMVWLDLLREPGRGDPSSRAQLWRQAWESEKRFTPLLADYRERARAWRDGLAHSR